MYIIDVDFKSGYNTLHRSECIHSVPSDIPTKKVGMLGDDGGWIEFNSPGEALRWLKNNKISGLIEYCKYCTPLSDFSPEPVAKLNIKLVKTGCDADCTTKSDYSKEIEITDTKSIYQRLVSKFIKDK
ncbi:hypothetical protein JW865_05565 [Candidatus Bathyarchaeota archaeon]|nr:hypothetical protein [Candidatus Bathyarchaeota archaeon]